MLGLAYTVLLGTVVGSGIWATLMKRNPSSRVAPFSMLVPVTGMTAAWATLGQVPSVADLIGAVIVIGGVLIASLPARGRAAAAVAESEMSAVQLAEPAAPAPPAAPSRQIALSSGTMSQASDSFKLSSTASTRCCG